MGRTTLCLALQLAVLFCSVLLCWGTAWAQPTRCDEVHTTRALAEQLNERQLYAEAGDDYLALWRRYGDECRDVRDMHFEQILEAAALAYQQAGQRARAIAVLRILLNPAHGLARSEAGLRAELAMGRNYQSLAMYERAARHYESFVERSPKMRDAPEALSDAIVLRLMLSDPDRATALVQQYDRLYGRKRPHDAALLHVGLARRLLDIGHAEGAIDELTRALARRPRSPHLRIHAWTLLGRAHAANSELDEARRAYGHALALWPFGNPAKLGSVPERLLGRSLTMVGEALYGDTQELRERADVIAPPRAGVSGHALQRWLQRRTRAIEAAERGYRRILALRPLPPPKWVNAALRSSATMWGAAHRELVAAGHNSTVTRTLEARARSSYQTCATHGIRHQQLSDATQHCNDWLRAHSAAPTRDDMLLPGLRTPPQFTPSRPLADPRLTTPGPMDPSRRTQPATG